MKGMLQILRPAEFATWCMAFLSNVWSIIPYIDVRVSLELITETTSRGSP